MHIIVQCGDLTFIAIVQDRLLHIEGIKLVVLYYSPDYKVVLQVEKSQVRFALRKIHFYLRENILDVVP